MIKGWDNGLTNMCVGEKRKLVIPSGLGTYYIVRLLLCLDRSAPATHSFISIHLIIAFHSIQSGYGDRGAGAQIPGGATLVFDVELLGIKGSGDKDL